MRYFLITILLIISIPCFAGTYYVSPTGVAEWGTTSGKCGHATEGRANPCTLDTASVSAVADDVVILLDGTYNAESYGIFPTNSGTDGHPITWQADTKYGAKIVSPNYGIELAANNEDCRSYHTFDGLWIAQTAGFMWVRAYCVAEGESVDGITIKNSKFTSGHGTLETAWGGILLCGHATKWDIYNNEIYGPIGSEAGTSDPIYITTAAAADVIEKIRIYNNTIYGGVHNAMMVQASYTGTVRKIVFRNNKVSNPNHTNIGFALGVSQSIIENNTLNNGGSICGTDGDLTSCNENVGGGTLDKAGARYTKTGLSLLGSDSFIVRNNILSNNGIAFNMDTPGAVNHRIYNNTVFSNCRGIDINVSSGDYDNWFINNIFYLNTLAGAAPQDYESRIYNADVANYYNYFENNYFYSTNPINWKNATDGTITNNITVIDAASSATQNNVATDPSFSLLNQYCGLNSLTSGRYLALTHGTGTITNTVTLHTGDGKYFYDGFGISGETGDVITVGAVEATISSITGDVLTLTSSISWADNAEVRLKKQGTKVGAWDCFYGPTVTIGSGPSASISASGAVMTFQ